MCGQPKWCCATNRWRWCSGRRCLAGVSDYLCQSYKTSGSSRSSALSGNTAMFSGTWADMLQMAHCWFCVIPDQDREQAPLSLPSIFNTAVWEPENGCLITSSKRFGMDKAQAFNKSQITHSISSAVSSDPREECSCLEWKNPTRLIPAVIVITNMLLSV